MLSPERRRREAGITMIESLTALLILALGVGGLAWTQARQLAEGREANARALALQLVQDLGNRMLLNRAAAAEGRYRLSWGERPDSVDCHSRRCSGSELAQADMAAWRATLGDTLPGSDASVFLTDAQARRIGIAIAWPVAETGTPAEHAPFAITLHEHGVDCPPAHRCHVLHAPI